MGEYFMYDEHRDVLIVYDDLSKHAIAYREMSLLLRRPPGREAFPGDVFYLHSRLLERSAQLSDEMGGGSITALPIVETLAGDISAYIPTNVISITDGQIYLETDLFLSGQRPAVNVGLSVSRVGGAAQIKAMKKVAAPIRVNLAQYRELAVFAQFGSDLDKATRNKLIQGERLVEIFKQPLHSTLEVEDQVILLYCATHRYLTNIPVNHVRKFNMELLKYINENFPQVRNAIRETGTLRTETEDTLKEAIEKFSGKYIEGNGIAIENGES